MISRAHLSFRPFSLASGLILSLLLASGASANPQIVVDVQTGRVLAHQEAFAKWYPASLTKLMTAYVAFKALKAGRLSLDTPVTMTRLAANQPPSKTGFTPGQRLTLDNALKIMLVKSANDMAFAVAETVGGNKDAFVAMMNAEAARLGMSATHFINPNGLPGQGQYTTARDLAVLSVALKRDFPEFGGYFTIEGIDTGTHKYPNYNLLIGRFDGADGMKTGFICASGFNQIASATRNGRSIVSVVLGTNSLAERAEKAANLIQDGFSKPAGTGDTLASLQPYGPGRDAVNDVSKEICSKKGAKIRSETRDDEGRMKINSPYVHEMAHEPNYVMTPLLPGVDPVIAAADAAAKEKAKAKKAAKKKKKKSHHKS